MEPMATDAQDDALTAAAEELYALLPDDFTAARNARAKQAKQGDRDLGDRIAQLRRPSPAAWLVNRLAREHPDDLDELLDLGDALREAQAAGDGRALTRLGSERRRLVSALVGNAVHLADAADRSTSRAVLDEVERTLVAGTVDAAAGAAVRTGRLIRGLQAVGLDEVDLDGAVAGGAPAAPSPKPRARAAAAGAPPEPAATDDTNAEADAADRAERERAERERAQTDLQHAQRLAEEAHRALTDAEDALTDAERHADELRAERQELEARLRALRAEITDAEQAERDAERARAKAATAADRADDAVDEAQQALDELD